MKTWKLRTIIQGKTYEYREPNARTLREAINSFEQQIFDDYGFGLDMRIPLDVKIEDVDA